MLGCWRGYLSGARCKSFACGPADATAIISSLASLKFSMFDLTFLVLVYPGCPGKKAIKRVVTGCKKKFAENLAVSDDNSNKAMC